jgi:probable F420-dependent oxidoreductase
MARFKVGVQLHPQATGLGELRAAWEAADALGVDSLWTWDHFYPLYGDPDAEHYECYSVLAAMAVTTQTARFGALVTCNSYRNPELLADMARTIDILSGGRFILGIGSGWFERDYVEYGYEFATPVDRLRALESSLPRIRERLSKLNPLPAGPLPILIGGAGEEVTLRLVSEYADMWNSFGPPDNFAHKNRVLDQWCEKAGRAPGQVERTVAIRPTELDDVDAYLEAGAEHFIVMMDPPFNLDVTRELLEIARG